MRALHRKLLRELRHNWVPVLSIALVMSCGTMTIMGLRSTLVSIRAARDQYFDAYRFGDVFARLQRAPENVAGRLAAIPGVATVDTRVSHDVKLDVPGLTDPATGYVVSLPETGMPRLNVVHVRRGRWPAPRSTDEVLVSERFAESNRLIPGDSVAAVINGRWRRLHIVGIGLSPEFVVELAASGGMFVDNRRFGVLWMRRSAMEAAFDMVGAFNDVAIRLAPGATEAAVIAQADRVLAPWGSTGAFGRRDQPSARTLDDEFTQLKVSATVFPVFFLIVASFLLNVVMSRLITSQREEIAALKAFGFAHREVGWHYLQFALAIVLLGAAIGVPSGAWIGAGFNALYADYFRFPQLPSRVDWNAATLAIGVSAGFGMLGAVGAVRRVMNLPPAEALLPETPRQWRFGSLTRIPLLDRLRTTNRMVLRNLERRPARTAAAIVGVGLAIALLATGRFPYDAFDRLIDVEFHQAQRYDASVVFTSTRPIAATDELAHAPEVVGVEGFRSVGIRLQRGATVRNTALTGLEPQGTLFRLTADDGRSYEVPLAGAVITAGLARVLGVAPGDTLPVQVLEQGVSRPVVVTAVVDPMIGQGLFMSRPAVNALLREGALVSGAYVSTGGGDPPAFYAALKAMPGVVSASSRAGVMRNIDEQMQQSVSFVRALIVGSACLIAIGVVYNSARITLAERGRELGSLRVLGFTSNEIARMLLGEQAAIVLLAVPAGVAVGALFSWFFARAFDNERFHFPFILTLRTQLFAVITVMIAAAGAGLVIRRRVGTLNMVTALRTRE